MIKRSNRNCWLALIIILWSSHLTISNVNSCWINDETCLVHGKLHKNFNSEFDPERETLAVDIDCASNLNDSGIVSMSDSVTQPPEYLLKRFERAFGLTLNGCHKGLMWKTFGFEFIPNCDKITDLTVEQFHSDVLYSLHCPHANFMQLEILRFQHNEFATVTAAALSNLSLLRDLYFASNGLRYLEGDSFDNLHFIERIYLENEPLLVIKDALLFQRTNVADLHLVGLKHVTSSLFKSLPETLLNLTIGKTILSNIREGESTTISGDVGVLHVNNSRKLRNLTITDCKLRSFKLEDVYGTVQFLNLSGNKLTEFELIRLNENTSSELQTLDLSSNQLHKLPSQLLHPHILNRLKELHLQGNLLKQLQLQTLLSSLPAIEFIDLSANKLEYLLEANLQFETAALYQLNIRIDDNPWNCKWLLEFARAHPDKFRVFQYEKFLSQINVNGLACVTENISYETTNVVESTTNTSRKLSVKPNDTYLNISTFTLIYGSPWDIKRNQRAEALVIIFMLPLGIAVLFLLLYLWIYCQKVFHLSFYQKFKFFKRRRTQPCVNRFDIVRQLPPNSATAVMNNNEGYELPMNGVAPTCNCAHNVSNSNSGNNTSNVSGEKCRKTHHITYVPLPDERAHQIYEEIIDSDVGSTIDAVYNSTQNVHPIYDHLTFE